MAQHVCPWWLGYLLASPLRRLWQDPDKLLAPYVREGMTLLEPGPGIGFFTPALARLGGPSGRVVAVDIQPRMLASLERRLRRAGLAGRVECRLAAPDSLAIPDLAGTVDFVLAFALVHELPSASGFFRELFQALKPGGAILLAEPPGHVTAATFDQELEAARAAGFAVTGRPSISRTHSALLGKPVEP